MHGFWFYLLLRDNAHTLLFWGEFWIQFMIEAFSKAAKDFSMFLFLHDPHMHVLRIFFQKI